MDEAAVDERAMGARHPKCGLVGAFAIDGDGNHNPALPNDRLVLGLKGAMSAFELSLIRKRLVDAAVAKAKRAELRIGVPVG